MTNDPGAHAVTVDDLLLDALTSFEVVVSDGREAFGLERTTRSPSWVERLTVKLLPRHTSGSTLTVDESVEVVADAIVAAIHTKGRAHPPTGAGGRRLVKGWMRQGLTTHAVAIVAEATALDEKRSRVQVTGTALMSIQNRRPAHSGIALLIEGLRAAHVTFTDTD